MAKIVTSKGQIIPEDSDENEDYICRLTLSRQGLIVEREEYLKENICLYDIPLNKIIEIEFLNKNEQSKFDRKSWLAAFADTIMLLIPSVLNIYSEEQVPKKADILKVSFKDDNRKMNNLVFDMLEYGEGGLARFYKELMNS